ncbi:HTH-type transcriptional repressor CsiR [Shimia sp. SK013]|nr:HTH-type transcriptional repressor CsiR [Shimia sp. SK013]
MQDDTPPTDGLHGTAAYAAVLSEIRDGVLSPGDRLRETEPAARLGISRTPVREAIRQLKADGLVTHVQRQGASVRRLSYAEVMELYEMRAVLEGSAPRGAPPRPFPFPPINQNRPYEPSQVFAKAHNR